MELQGDRRVTRAFRPRARLLQLLGDQLIGSPRLAMFELVKNAYDADADHVTIEFRDVGTPEASIVVEDDGQGMTLDTIANVWLVPGDDHRERERLGSVRSPKHGRLPLGEKGVGRFAVHKLGDRIELVTRATASPECVADIRWDELLEHEFLSEAEVTVREREPEVFRNGTGTRLVISRLRSTDWSRGEIRDLYRQVTSITSPFGDRNDGFIVEMAVRQHPEWLSSLLGVSKLLDLAPHLFDVAQVAR